jgi:hypothetical protein
VKRSLAVLIVALALVASACSPADEDQRELERSISRSELQVRAFDFVSHGTTDAYEVTGAFADDLRYKMSLSHEGRQVIQFVVSDDALAVRLPDPDFGKQLANELGHPTVDAALKAGKWVVDPSGAPPLFRRDATPAAGAASDPFTSARGALRAIDAYITDARAVKEFSLEDIEYRPQYDPWRYPEIEGAEEIRYDLVRPALPKSEAQVQTGGGAGADIATVGHFRKTSVFVRDDRVHQVCSTVDIDGHEDIVRLREEGLDSNPFLAGLLKLVKTGQTAVPIEPRTSIITVRYPKDVVVTLPGDAVRGKLATFLSAFQQGVTGGVLRPQKGRAVRECRREATGPSQ